jgi:hypothetical protein
MNNKKMNNKFRLAAVAAALSLGIALTSAQEPATLQTLQKQLQEMRSQFAEQQRLHAQRLELMQQQIDKVGPKADAPSTTVSQPAPLDPTDISSVTSGALAPRTPATASAPGFDQRRWRPSDPIGIRRGQASLDLGLTGTFTVGGSTADDLGELNGGGHDPNARGFTVQAVEANFAGAIDPYFRGSANLNFAIAANGESFMEVEEGWLETQALPLGLQLRVGQIWSQIGRHNPTHIHAWGFVDQPLAVSRLLGPDGMRNPGARLSWLAPTPWHTELSFTAQNSGGGNASSFRGGSHTHGGAEEEEGIPFGFRHQENDRGVRSASDMLLNPRIALSYDLSDTQTLLIGGSAAMGPNNSGEGGETDTLIYGADLTWKWQARDHNQGYPFVSLQSEFLARRYGAGFFDWDEEANGGDGDGNGFVDDGLLTDPGTGLPAVLTPETIADYGLYSQLLYGFRPRWIAGLRYGYVFGDRAVYEGRGLGVADNAGGFSPLANDSERGNRFRVSPNLTWRPTEYSKIRLQYNYDDRDKIGVDHSLWLQMEMSLGAHGAHQF